MRFNPTLRLMDSRVNEITKAAGEVVEKVKTKDLIKTIKEDLAVPDLFKALEKMTTEQQNELFNGILEEQKEALTKGNEKFLRKLEELASGGTYPLENKKGEKNDYFAKKRPAFLHMLSEARFFSNINLDNYDKLKEYTRTLGNLKDVKGWYEMRHRELITDNKSIMGNISNLEAGNVTNLKAEYRKVVTEIQELLEKKGKEFKKTEFHEVRKNLRFAAYLIQTLNKEFNIPEAERIYEKYMSISNQLAHVREVKGRGDMSWKDAVKDVLKGINNKSDLEGRSGPSLEKPSKVTVADMQLTEQPSEN